MERKSLKEMKRERLKRYLEAEAKILTNQKYRIGDREYERAELEDVSAAIDNFALDDSLGDESDRKRRVKRVVFIS